MAQVLKMRFLVRCRTAAEWTAINEVLLMSTEGTGAREMGVEIDTGRFKLGDGVTAWNDAARADRQRLLEAQLAGGTVHELRVSVPNEPGVVARLALELGRAGVNINDMALYPAPNQAEGVVALWIAGDEPAQRAEQLVEQLGFPVARA